MSLIYIVTMFDGSDWRPIGDDPFVTRSGAERELQRLSNRYPNHRFDILSRRAFLHRL